MPQTKSNPKAKPTLAQSLTNVESHIARLRDQAKADDLTWYVTLANAALDELRSARNIHSQQTKLLITKTARIDRKLTGIEQMTRFMARSAEGAKRKRNK